MKTFRVTIPGKISRLRRSGVYADRAARGDFDSRRFDVVDPAGSANAQSGTPHTMLEQHPEPGPGDCQSQRPARRKAASAFGWRWTLSLQPVNRHWGPIIRGRSACCRSSIGWICITSDRARPQASGSILPVFRSMYLPVRMTARSTNRGGLSYIANAGYGCYRGADPFPGQPSMIRTYTTNPSPPNMPPGHQAANLAITITLTDSNPWTTDLAQSTGVFWRNLDTTLDQISLGDGLGQTLMLSESLNAEGLRPHRPGPHQWLAARDGLLVRHRHRLAHSAPQCRLRRQQQSGAANRHIGSVPDQRQQGEHTGQLSFAQFSASGHCERRVCDGKCASERIDRPDDLRAAVDLAGGHIGQVPFGDNDY